MDPDTALDNARRALSRVLAASEAQVDDCTALAQAGQDLADAFEALDTWLTRGGLFPAAWMKERKP